MTTNSSNLLWIDLLRVVACFFVVLFHVCSGTMFSGSVIDNHPITWWSANALRSATAIAVPLFFMFSGYLLLGKDEPLGTFYKKRASKILIPFIFWSLIYYGIFLALGIMKWEGLYVFFRIVKDNAISSHFWFLYAIISLYLIVPFLRKYVLNADEKNILLFLTLWMIFQSIGFMVECVSPFSNADGRFSYEVLTRYVGFFVLGHYLGRKECSKTLIVTCLVSIGIVMAMTMMGTFFATTRWMGNVQLMKLFHHPNSLNVIAMSCLAFVCFKYWGERINMEIIKTWISILAPLSFGIYLVHMLFVRAIRSFIIPSCLQFESLSVITLLVFSIFCFIVSAFVICGIRKIPYGKWLAP